MTEAEGGASAIPDDADEHAPGAPARPTAADLPSVVRSRAVVLACAALGELPSDHVPAPLRRAAAFAPQRRARVAGGLVLEVVDADSEFRKRLATRLAADVPQARDQVLAVEAGEPSPVGAERVDAAAVAYLTGSSATRALVDVVEAAEAASASSTSELEDAVERLQQQLTRAKGDAKTQRGKHRRDLDQVKAENQQLRRTLGQTRADLKAAQAERDEAVGRLESVRGEAEHEARQAAADLRRARARVTELEQGMASVRRSARDDRAAASTRLRLLVDTLQGSVQGLRRELDLGAAEVLPADLVDTAEPSSRSAGRPAALQDDPGTLRRWLALPQAHVIIDGYNVSKSAWPSAPLDQQRSRLVAAVAGLAAGTGLESTVVFDGSDVASSPAMPAARGVRMRFSPPGVIADDTVRAMVDAEPSGRVVVVVTSDRELAESVVERGAYSATAAAWVALATP